MVESEFSFEQWAALLGRWELIADRATYRGPAKPEEAAVGLLRAPDSYGITAGQISAFARRPQPGMLVDHNPFAGLGLRRSSGRKDLQPPDQATIARMIAAADELTLRAPPRTC